MDIKPMTTAICRTPAFSPCAQASNSWPTLKVMIKEASPEFYRVIAGLSYEQLAAADEKTRFSVWKYWNRARYRATPFGSFAAISFIPLGPLIGPLILDDDLICHAFTDWSRHDEPAHFRPHCFQANTTWYRTGNEIRYIRSTGEHFELATVTGSAEIVAVLESGSNKADRKMLREMLLEKFGLNLNQVDNLLQQMLNNQLLLSENSVNITGPDYFERMNFHSEGKKYIIAERALKSGGLDPVLFEQLPGYFSFIQGFVPATDHPDLENFRREFIRKFDRKAIPLIMALDPETGVGYGDMVGSADEQILSSVFEQSRNGGQLYQASQSDLPYRFLLKSLLNGGPIHLEEFNSHVPEHRRLLPNTFSAMLRIYNDTLVLENAGGCTANSLLGRFTVISPEAEVLGREIAEAEQNANPEVRFFDIAYQAEKTVDNVNRRRQLYQQELPILCWSCSNEPLALNDLLVMVKNSEIILWSQKHQCRVIPRLASAYNYARSDLVAYRFLCDLQHQSLQYDLNFRFRDIFPELEHYPRVMYKNTIVSGAMWKFNPLEPTLNGLKDWFREKQINMRFTCGQGDQTLCYDPQNDDDLSALLIYHRQQHYRTLYLTEALLSDTINGKHGVAYHAQYIINFSNDGELYSNYTIPKTHAGPSAYLPGSEWLYFEIYCHPARANQVLQLITKFTGQYRKIIHKWFFIRYTDPRPHLRLRIHLKNITDTGLLITELNKNLESLCSIGLISDIQLKTYYRESERYGAGRIPLAEDFFYRDSVRVAKLLYRVSSTEQLYVCCVNLMEKLLLLAKVKDQISLISLIADKFSQEFSMGKDHYKQINRSFEKIKHAILIPDLIVSKAYATSFINTIRHCSDDQQKNSLIADIFHMHINRVFNNRQRMHETILYQYLLKLLQARQFHPATRAEPGSEH